MVYDLISKKNKQFSGDTLSAKSSRLISITFSFYYDYILAGNFYLANYHFYEGDTAGNLSIFKIYYLRSGIEVEFLKLIKNFHQ